MTYIEDYHVQKELVQHILVQKEVEKVKGVLVQKVLEEELKDVVTLPIRDITWDKEVVMFVEEDIIIENKEAVKVVADHNKVEVQHVTAMEPVNHMLIINV